MREDTGVTACWVTPLTGGGAGKNLTSCCLLSSMPPVLDVQAPGKKSQRRRCCLGHGAPSHLSRFNASWESASQPRVLPTVLSLLGVGALFCHQRECFCSISEFFLGTLFYLTLCNPRDEIILILFCR